MKLTEHKVTDPLEELLVLAGKTLELVDGLEGCVSRLESVGTAPGRFGEQVQPALQAYLSALNRAQSILTNLVKLDLEARWVRLDEKRVQILVATIEGTLRDLGLDHRSPAVRAAVHHRLQLVSGGEGA